MLVYFEKDEVKSCRAHTIYSSLIYDRFSLSIGTRVASCFYSYPTCTCTVDDALFSCHCFIVFSLEIINVYLLACLLHVQRETTVLEYNIALVNTLAEDFKMKFEPSQVL